MNIDWKSPFLKGMGQFGPKVEVEGDISHQPFFSSQNYTLNHKKCDILFLTITLANLRRFL